MHNLNILQLNYHTNKIKFALKKQVSLISEGWIGWRVIFAAWKLEPKIAQYIGACGFEADKH
jgi:hypothetical protein